MLTGERKEQRQHIIEYLAHRLAGHLRTQEVVDQHCMGLESLLAS